MVVAAMSVSERIARLFAEGQPISAVIARGLAGDAWGRLDVATELTAEARALLVAAAESAAAEAKIAAERKRAQERLASLESEARALRAELNGGRVQKRSRPRATGDADIEHGTLSGFLKEVRR